MGQTKPKTQLLGPHTIPSSVFRVTHSTRHHIWHTQVPSLPRLLPDAADPVQSCKDQLEYQDYNTHKAEPPLDDKQECGVGLKVKLKAKRYLNSVSPHTLSMFLQLTTDYHNRTRLY